MEKQHNFPLLGLFNGKPPEVKLTSHDAKINTMCSPVALSKQAFKAIWVNMSFRSNPSIKEANLRCLRKQNAVTMQTLEANCLGRAEYSPYVPRLSN
jgi:hypothetical protein